MTRHVPPTPWTAQVQVQLRGQNREVVAIAYLDREETVLDLRLLCEGQQGMVALPLRDILRDILMHDPASIGLAHNHPSGDLSPSASDRRATQALCALLRPLGVRLADHLIIAGDKHVSFRALGLL